MQIDGTAGDDYLLGGDGDDTLYGGTGDDTLNGGYGDNVYLFEQGWGKDVINFNQYSESAQISFGAGILVADLVVSSGTVFNELIISTVDGANRITIPGYYESWGEGVLNISLVFADGSSVSALELRSLAMQGTSANDKLSGNATSETISGGLGNDTLWAWGGDDAIDGGAGNDWLDGGAGNDILEGGAGNDRLEGDVGSDTYRFSRGWGQDTIENEKNSNYNLPDDPNKVDVIEFAAGISSGDILVYRKENDLVLQLDGSTDAITVRNYFFGGDYSLEQVRFADGLVWSASDILSIVQPHPDQELFGDSADNVIHGYDGNDMIVGMEGDDTLYGDSGIDSLNGWTGNDVLIGGAGDDVLDGNDGGDIYIFGLGDGQDVILNAELAHAPNELGYVRGEDTLQFSSGVGSDDVVLSRGSVSYLGEVLNGDSHLTLAIKGTSDKISIINYFGNSEPDYGLDYSLKFIKFEDGTVWTMTDVQAWFASHNDQVINGDAYDNILTGGLGNDTISGLDGADELSGADGNDQLFGDAGDDVLYGEAGDDLLNGGAGNDSLIGGAGENQLLGGAGDDSYEVSSTVDLITELADEGFDLVNASVSYSLGDNIEDLTLTGAENLSATGNVSDNTLTGNDGNNLLDGGAGADMLVGGFGDDNYLVDDLGDSVLEGADQGVDTVISSVDFVLADSIENLTLIGSAVSGFGNDLTNLIIGNAGDNQLDGGLGADTLVGGLGNDSYSVDAGDLITELAGEGVDSAKVSFSYTLGANLENLELLGNLALNGTGNELDNRLNGNAANNRLSGGAGNDYLDGGAGADTLLGGLGDDTYVVEGSGDLVTESANQGIDSVLASRTYTLGSNLENLSLTGSTALNGTGNSLANRLHGNTAANSLSGGAGNDTLVGGQGNDQLLGGVGSDTYLFARGDGADVLSENDTTQGNMDRLLFSGVNHDQLWFRAVGSNNLEVSVIGTSDKVTVSNWNLGVARHVEQIVAGDGLALSDAQVANLVNAMAAFAPPAVGQTNLSSSYHAALDAVIAANWQ